MLNFRFKNIVADRRNVIKRYTSIYGINEFLGELELLLDDIIERMDDPFEGIRAKKMNV